MFVKAVKLVNLKYKLSVITRLGTSKSNIKFQ